MKRFIVVTICALAMVLGLVAASIQPSDIPWRSVAVRSITISPNTTTSTLAIKNLAVGNVVGVTYGRATDLHTNASSAASYMPLAYCTTAGTAVVVFRDPPTTTMTAHVLYVPGK